MFAKIIRLNMGWEFWYIIHKKYIFKKSFDIFI